MNLRLACLELAAVVLVDEHRFVDQPLLGGHVVLAVLVGVAVHHAGNTVVAAGLAALGDDLGGLTAGVSVLGFHLVAAFDLQGAVGGGCTGGRVQGAGVLAAAGGHLGQRDRLRLAGRQNFHRHLYRARTGIGIVHPDVQRVARLETISRRLVAAVGEEVNLRAHRTAGGCDLVGDLFSRALVVGRVLVGGGDRVAVANRDGAVARNRCAVAVGVDGAGEEAGVIHNLGQLDLLGVTGVGGDGQHERAVTLQVKVIQRDVQRVAHGELRYFGVESVVGEPHITRGGLSGGRLECAQIQSRHVRRPAGFIGVVLRRVREGQSLRHDLDGKDRICRHHELEVTLSVETVLVGPQGCGVGIYGGHAGLGYRVAGGVLHHTGHGGVFHWRLKPVVGAGSGYLVTGVGVQVDCHRGIDPHTRIGSRSVVVPYTVHGSGLILVAGLQTLHGKL